MKTFKIYAIILLVSMSLGCAMLKNEIERSVQKDVKEYLDKNFKQYADVHHANNTMRYRENLKWGITFASGTLGIGATVIGLCIGYRKLKRKKDAIV
jgi:thiamine phosphate synthase YjbQ (UPF0047 family)